MRRLVSALVVLAVVFGALPARGGLGMNVKVIVPDRESMQLAAFWVALGGDYFNDEGYEVELVVPPTPAEAQSFYEQHRADIAVLPPTAWSDLIAKRVDIVLLANLLANDPVELIVRRSVEGARRTRETEPLHQRLDAIRGVRIGIAPHSIARFRTLYRVGGLDADRDATRVALAGKDQNAAFHAGDVDALYADSPYLERALVHDDASVLVDQAGGDVQPLTNHLLYVLCAHQALVDAQRPVAVGFVRAIQRAERLIRKSPKDATAILVREFPERDRREIEAVMKLYALAVPRTPAVSFGEIPVTTALYSDSETKPTYAGVDLTRFVSPEVFSLAEEKTSPDHGRLVMVWGALIALATIAVGFATKRIGAKR